MKKLFFFSMLATFIVSVYSVRAIPLPVSPWTWPLGEDGFRYIVLENSKHGTTLENTNYSVRNLDLVRNGHIVGDSHINCFGVGFHRMHHAGVDLYRAFSGNEVTPENSTAGAEVHAVFDGVVTSIEADYPGFVVIVEHTLPEGNQLYSMYAHLQSVAVVANQSISIGQNIGTVLFQTHTGRFSEFHPLLVNENGDPILDDDGNIQLDDSHLHFEIRTFGDASDLFPEYPNCPETVPGLGYTYPNLPDSYGYIDPLAYIADTIGTFPFGHNIYLPIIQSDESCVEGQNLIMFNSGFEFPIDDPRPWFEITTFYDVPNIHYYHVVQNDAFQAWEGQHSAFFGDQVILGRIVDEEMVQSVHIPAGTSWVEWQQFIKIRGQGPFGYGTDFGDKFILTLKDAQTGLPVVDEIVIDHTSTGYANEVWLDWRLNIGNINALDRRNISPSISSFTDGDATASTLRVDRVRLITHCSGNPPSNGTTINLVDE